MGEKLINKYNIRLNSDKTKLVVDGRIGKSSKDTEWLKAHRAEVIEILLEREAKAEAAHAKYIKKLEAIKGLIELQCCISDWDTYNRSMSRYIERDCLGEAPKKPQNTVEELTEKYPKAAAYIKADKWSYSSHSYKAIKAMCGEKAKQRILDGDNYQDVISDMIDSWGKYVEETTD